MLSIQVNRLLASLISDVYLLLESVVSGGTVAEVHLRLDEIHKTLDDLQEITGLGPTGPFNSLARHLHWMERRHRENRPEDFAVDIADIRERDLPGIISAVESWARSLLEEGLVGSISASWTAQHYDSAIRDAFIYLEDRLRDLGGVDPEEGLSGDRLVSRLLSPSSPNALSRNNSGLISNLTSGEREGVFNFFKGAFLYFRNATAHRPIHYGSTDAEDVIHIVNMCLRMLDGFARESGEE